MQTPQCLYKGKDTEILLAIFTMMDSAARYAAELISEQGNREPPFSNTLKRAFGTC